MSRNSASSHTSGRSRRRLAAWLAFGAVGLATGAVWASGFATLPGAHGSSVASPTIAVSDPTDHAALLSGAAVANATPLAYSFVGRWGSVVDTNLFTIDLSAMTGTFNVALLLGNATALANSGWTTLQLEVEQVTASGGSNDTCVPADYDGAQNPEIMKFDAADAGVYFNGLAGGTVYCVGVNGSNGQDPLGTLLRTAVDNVDPTAYPQFIATVDRAV